MFKIIERRYWFFLFSTIIIIPGLVSVALFGIPRSIDFVGGSFFELEFSGEPVEGATDPIEEVTPDGLREVFLDVGFESPPQVILAEDSTTGVTRHQLRATALSTLTEDLQAANPDLEIDQTSLKADLYDRLKIRFGAFEERQFTDVGPSVGAQVTRNAAIAVALACIGILLYLSVMFRNVPHPVRYGAVAIAALVHDVILTLGIASMMGHFFNWEVDALFLTALLTVIGFSVHDSIVVFDRIRENVGRMRGASFEEVVNHSVIQTLDRSINTQLTAIFTLMAIWLYSQGQLETFTFWLIVGMVSGTYSSICNAAPLLVVWNNREWENWFGRGEKAAA